MTAHLKGSEAHVRAETSSLRIGLKEMSGSSLAPDALQPRHIQRMLDANRGRACARHRYGAWSRFYDHLMSLEVVKDNPCLRIAKKNRPKPPAPRTRVYTAGEVQSLMAAGKALEGPHGQFLRAAIYLPLRAAELQELRVGEVDLGRRMITLDGKQTKNGDPFSMPIPEEVLPIFEACKKEAPGDRVFQLAPGGGRFSGQTKYARRIREHSGIKDFNFHHLRRTFVTTLAEHDTGNEVVADALLNHRKAAIRGGWSAFTTTHASCPRSKLS